MKALRDSAADLAKFDADVYMVSLDDPEKNKEFAESLGADFVLLTASKDMAKAYGVLRLGGLFTSRHTIYVDPAGRIRHIDKSVNVSSHGQDIVNKLSELGFPQRAPAD